jgi:tetratricopeptide (TPR) repeat protein
MIWFLAGVFLAASLTFAQTPTIEEQTRRAKEALLAERYPEAIQAYKQLLNELPNEPGLRFNLALAFHSSGKYREAVQQLEMIRGPGTTNPKFWFLLGLGYLKLDLAGKAIEPLRRSLALDSTSLDTRQELADALLEKGDFLEAEEQFRQLGTTPERLPKALEGLALSEIFASREAYEHLQELAPASSYIYGLAALVATESHKDGARDSVL